MIQEQSKEEETIIHVKKRRRISFLSKGIKWDESLEPSPQLRKLHKSRLGGTKKMTAEVFKHLQYQLYKIGAVKLKTGKNIATNKPYEYTYTPTSSADIDIEDETYMKVIKKLTAEEACKLLIFRYYNLTQATSPEFVQELLNHTWTEAKNGSRAQKQLTTIRINENFILQKVKWTKVQRKAVANTRDLFLQRGSGTSTEKPFLSDIPFFRNDEFYQSVLIGFLTAKVPPKIMCDICESCFLPNIQSDLIFLEDQDEIEREIITTLGQRNSITVITEEMENENKAAVTIQRAFRQHIQTKIRAVRIIERWWYQLERERYEVISEIAEEMQEALDRANLRTEDTEDLFNWKRFAEEVKDDYKKARHPEPRLPSYWFKALAIVTLPIVGAIEAVSPYEYSFIGFNPPTLIFYMFLLWLIHYKHNFYATWIQTLGMWFFTVALLNQLFILYNGWIRVYAWIVIVAVGRRHWMALFFVSMCIRVFLSFWYDVFSIQPVEYYVFLYDFYSITTIAAASRQGTPIQMLQKVMINIVMLLFIISSGVLAWMAACLRLNT